MTDIFYIGGSPCSGKSTVAEILSKNYNLCYFKVDDFLDKYMQSGASKGYLACSEVIKMNPDQIWMRDPLLQCNKEIQIYLEVFEFIQEDLRQLNTDKPVITEGAAYLPQLMKQCGIPSNRYLSITPTPEFQIYHYRKREWISYVLEGCSDKEKAFSNWMERDILFAENVRQQCGKEQYISLVNNGEMPVSELVNFTALHFGLIK